MNRILTRWGRGALPIVVLLGLHFPADADHGAYAIKAITQIGAKVGDVQLPSATDNRFFVGSLSDHGQITFGVGTSLANRFYQGYFAYGKPDWMLRYAKGQFTPIVVPGQETAPTVPPGIYVPADRWRDDVNILWPFGVNRDGDIAFAVTSRGSDTLGTYVWDAQEQRAIAIATPGMPAPDGGRNLAFTQAGGFGTAINNGGDVVLSGIVKGPSGSNGPGLWFNGRDGKMLPIVLPGSTLPGGAKIQATYFAEPSINDDGEVAFLARRQGESHTSAFLWKSGNLSMMVHPGMDAQPGFKLSAVTGVWLNNKNDNALVTAWAVPLSGNGSSQHGVYRLTAGILLPVAVPEQQVPGGSKIRNIQNIYSVTYFGSLYDPATICLGVSPASRVGEHVILATLQDGGTAAYRVDTKGRLWPVLKSGDVTKLGTITRVGVDSPASINQAGQVALSVRINNGAPMLVLLTPDT